MGACLQRVSSIPGDHQEAEMLQTKKVQTLIMTDCLKVQEIAEVGTNVGSADTILNDDLGMHRVAAKYVPKHYALEQR